MPAARAALQQVVGGPPGVVRNNDNLVDIQLWKRLEVGLEVQMLQLFEIFFTLVDDGDAHKRVPLKPAIKPSTLSARQY